MSEFKREVRYTVIKHSQLTESQMQYLKGCIFGEGIPTVKAVVVESDWPEFEPVWKMIEDRVFDAPAEGGKAEYDALAASMPPNQTIDGVSRELLERFKACAEAYVDIDDSDLVELRALLDAPACKTPSGAVCPGDGVGQCKKCPTVQPQGEPAAYLDLEKIQPAGMAYATKMRVNHRQTALYAEQPRSTELLALLRQVIENEEGFAFDHELLARIKVVLSSSAVPLAWTEADVLDFMSVALRHAEYSGLSPSDILDGLRYMAEKGKPAFYRAEQPAPSAVVPDGYCIMPRQLTAENGSKALLLGEFKLLATKECPECCELEEPTEGCSICDGEGEYGQKHTIPWDQIKHIYSKAVSGLAVKTESAKSR
ncbi:hypothetical protein [Pseudomonas fluorescens]|uniref:Uncharacterized protein n=1 Tax=Pseudomonas fluorescens TaxID=294 RepID=A0A109KMX7_PSEFL|nr:hypothetical protein [Pseudomonas fluorescens]KWV72127.1 hypothetical protein PFL603g_04668 [Pseudomonas fluorescens]